MSTPVLHGLARGFAHGRAFTQVQSVANPAAGVGFTYTVGNRYWERPVALAFRLVSAAAAANRQVSVDFRDESGVTVAKIPVGGTQAANLTRDYVLLPNISVPQAVVDGVFVSPLPDMFLQPTYTIVVGITNVQAADQVSRIRLTVERFDTGPEGFPIGMVDETPALDRQALASN